jgi:two-component system response regulator HydG
LSRRILIVDDDERLGELLVSGLAPLGYEVTPSTQPEEALELFGARDFDVVVTDLNMPGLKGTELCHRCVATRADVPVIVITGFGSLETAVEAIRAGAYDFVTKPFEVEELALALDRAVQHRTLEAEVKRLRVAASRSDDLQSLLGTSAPMEKVRDLLERVADNDATILITGETGTGKEIAARVVHDLGPRKQKPFVAVSCAAVPEHLLEVELFGHVKGAFTDARADRKGIFAQADGGTLFLDEVGDIPLALQVKLLRVLQERSFRPVGGPGEVPFDVRLIAATNRDLESAVEEGRFREDLYYRLNVIHVALPPLRSRSADVLLLAQRFLECIGARIQKNVKGLSSRAAEKLLAYGWPGNVRELQNCMERAVALARFDEIAVEDLPEKIRRAEASHVIVAGDDPSELVPMEEIERRYVLRVIEALGGNKTLAAQVLGFDRRTLYRKLERYERRGS